MSKTGKASYNMSCAAKARQCMGVVSWAEPMRALVRADTGSLISSRGGGGGGASCSVCEHVRAAICCWTWSQKYITPLEITTRSVPCSPLEVDRGLNMGRLVH